MKVRLYMLTFSDFNNSFLCKNINVIFHFVFLFLYSIIISFHHKLVHYNDSKDGGNEDCVV